MFVEPTKNQRETSQIERSATIERKMNIKYTYQFIIPGQKPYTLSNMKMIMWAQFTMTSEGYGCVLGDYNIDGKRFTHQRNPTFIKRDTLDPK